MNFATSNGLSKTKQRERSMGCIVYSPHWLWTNVINGKPQTPTVIPARTISTNWGNWTLK